MLPLKLSFLIKSSPLKIARIVNILIIAISFFTLIGWLTGNLILASWGPGYKPVAISASLLFLLFSTLLLVATRWPKSKFLRAGMVLAAMAAIGCCTHALIHLGAILSIDNLMCRIRDITFFVKNRNLMSPLSALGFIAAALGLLPYAFSERMRRFRIVSDILAVSLFLLGSICSFAYLYRTPLLYGGLFAPIALPAALMFILLAVAFVAHDPASSLILRMFQSPSIQSRLLRTFLPAVMLIMIIARTIFTRLNFHSTGFNPALLTALVSIIVLVMAAIMIAVIARIVGRDIESAQKALRESEEKSRGYVENAPDGISILDDNGRFVEVNKAICFLTGYSEEELKQKNLRELLADESREAGMAHFSKIKETGFAESDLYHTHKNGSVVCLNIKAVKLISNRIIGFSKDVTQHKKMEDGLRASEKRYRELVDNAVQAIIIAQEGKIIFVNPMAVMLSGYSNSELSSTPFMDFIHPDDRNMVMERHLARMQGSAPPVNYAFRFLPKNGRVLWVEIGTVPIAWEGKPAALSFLSDITERRKAEEVIVKNAALLKSLVFILQRYFQNTKDLLDFALDEAIKLTESKIGYIYYYSEERAEFTLNTWSKDVMQECSIEHPPTIYQLDKTGIWGEAVRQRKPIIVNNFQAENPLKKGYPQGHVALNKFLTVPVIIKEKIVAVVGVANNPADYDETDVLQLTLLMSSTWKAVNQVEAEQTLRQSEERFRTVADFTYDWETWRGVDGKFIYVSPSVERITGYRAEEFMQDASLMENLVHPLDPERLAAHNHINPHKERDAEYHNIDFRIITKSGEERWISHSCLKVYSKNGEYLGRRASNRDITDRKHGEEVILTKQKELEVLNEMLSVSLDAQSVMNQNLAIERERLAVTLRSIGDGVITTDTKGIVVIMNKVAEELTGWSLAEAQGKPLFAIVNLVNDTSRQPLANLTETVLASGETVEMAPHTLLIGRDKKEHLIAASYAPIRNLITAITGVVLVFHDITEKQKLLDQMQRAEKLDSLGVLAGGIAHDFNNLLSGIFGYIDMAREHTNNDPETAKLLNKAVTVFDRAKNLTQQLLTFSKGGAPMRKTGNLGKVVHDCATFALSGSKIASEYHFADDLWPCDFDENQISQVIDNMVINAQQTMPRGGKIVISVSNETVSDRAKAPLPDGKYIKISIADTGVGIRPDLLKRIFDPFFTTKHAGSGLGLATSYSIVQKHDGCIGVESEPGKGSVFHIFLPASQKQISQETPLPEFSHTGIGRILVMDDEDFVREIIGNMLIKMGYTVVAAKDGEEALMICGEASARNKPIDAAIFDLTIPGGMGGKEAQVEMAQRFPVIPVFASSGYSEDPVMANPKEFGFIDSICKPYREEHLAEMLNRHVKSK